MLLTFVYLVLCNQFGLLWTYTDRKPPNIRTEVTGTPRYFTPWEPVQLPCEADGNPKPRYFWTRNGKPFHVNEYPGNVVQLPNKGDLMFKNPGSFDVEAVYQCFAENEHGTSVSDIIHLVKARLNTFDIFDTQTYTAEEGQHLTLRCIPPVSKPRAEIYWSLLEPNGREVPVNLDQRVNVDLEGNLHITNVRKSDERDGASYICMARNPILLVIQRGPAYHGTVTAQTETYTPVQIIWASPSYIFVLRGDTLSLMCFFAGNPTPEVEWKRPRGILSGNAKVENFGQELRIKNIQVSDAGKYTCTGRTSLDRPHESREFDVKIESAPFWVEEPQDVEASINENATFICKADGDPKPEHKWYINGVPLEDNVDGRDASIYIDKRFSMPDPYTITLSKLTLDDQMNIQCNASNKHGYVFSDVYLYVTSNILDTARLEVSPKDIEVVKGNNVTFICSVNKDEMVDIKVNWERGGEHVEAESHRIILGDNSLSIFGAIVKDTGVYTCVIKTDSGKVRAYGSLKVIDTPSPPEQVEMLSCWAKSAHIKWINGNDNNAPIQQLHIQYSTSYHPEVWTTAKTVNYTDTASISLSPYANYTFRVIATNKVGDSLPSVHAPYLCSTPPDRPYINPRNVTSIRDTKGVLEIKWTPMSEEEHNGPYFGYQIYYEKRDKTLYDYPYMYTVHDWKTNSMTAPVKQSYTPYIVKVQATNMLGNALEEPSEYIMYTYEDIPKVLPFGVKVTSKGNTAAEVDWKWDSSWLEEKSEINDIQGPLKGFKIRYWCTGSKSDTLEEVDVPLEDIIPDVNYKGRQIQSTYSLTSLTRCKYIQVEVAVRNNFYVGTPSDSIMLYVGREKDPRPPNILQQPPSKIFFRIGQQVKLLCKAGGNPKPMYRWTRNGELYFFSITRGRVTQVEGEGTLVFNNTQYYDEGIYQCQARNRFGVSISDNTDMRKAKLGTFYNEPKRTHTVEVGTQLTLPCTPPVSVPSAEISWVLIDADHGPTPISLDDRISVDIEGRLRFANVKKSDEEYGRSYSCSAANKVVRMIVHGPEHVIQVFGNKGQNHSVNEFYTSPRDQIVLKGERMRLQCIFAGNPTPEVEWKRLHGILSDDAKVENFGKELCIENVQSSDAGKYTCTGRNSLGTPISKEFDVKVESAPYWVEEPQDVEASINEKATFICKADGDPKPEHKWYINGVALKDNEAGVQDPSIYNDKRFSMPDPFTITLSKLTLDDHMNVQCNASNKHGYMFSDVYLYVRTNILNTLTIEVKPKDVEVVKGDNVTFKCSINNDEKFETEVNWERDGKHVQTEDDHRVTLDTNSMSIFGTTVKDTGVYTCVIKTDLGEVRADGSLKVIDSPSPPEQVEILGCWEKSSQIKWINGNDNNAPIQHLHIQYNTSYHPEVWTTAKTVEYTDTASISLSPYANYTFRVIATNKVGDSLPSVQTPYLCSTPPDRPYTNPRNVTSIRDTKGVLEIKWTPMEEEEHNGPHFGYQIYLKQRDISPDVSYQYIVNDWRTNVLQIPVEHSYTPYLVTVQARNALGNALEKPTEYTLYSYEDIPKVWPFEVKVTSKGNTTAEVEWKWDSNWLEEQGEINGILGPLKGFKMRHWCTGSKSNTLEEVDVPIEDVIPDVTFKGRQIQSTYIYTNLNKCNNIQVEVAVRNSFYVGMPSDTVMFYVDREKDTRPPNILEEARSNVVYFRPGQEVKLACRAEGYPTPEYKWTRNGKSYRPDFAGSKITQVEGEGTLFFNYIRSYDEGIYQCQAGNSFGVSVTDKITLKRAKLEMFHRQPTRIHTVEEGDRLTLPCYPPVSVPTPKISWTGVSTNDRVSIDIEGNLRFANVKKSDGRYGRPYSCTVMNHVLRMIIHGPAHVIHVYGKEQNHSVKELYTSPSDQIFLKGEKLRLQCIFAGNPTPHVNWKKPKGALPSRAWINSGTQELQIYDLRESDSGQYECTDDSGTISKTFDVRIESAPYWVEELKNVVAGFGEEAQFVCKADGDPKPQYTWYINGRSLESLYETGFRDPRFRMKDPSTLIVSNLRLDDQMNIQCNASNKHGYVFSDAYLDILENIVLYYPTQRPPSAEPPLSTTTTTTAVGEITSLPSITEDRSDTTPPPLKEPRERDTHSQENSSSEENTTDRGGEIIAGQGYDVPDQDS